MIVTHAERTNPAWAVPKFKADTVSLGRASGDPARRQADDMVLDRVLKPMNPRFSRRR
jgi:hypothetical protein